MEVAWNGVYAAVTTKFFEEEELDISAFQKNIQAQMDAGVHGIILGGTLGEASSLSSKEKETLVVSAREVCNGQIPVILNVAEQRTTDAMAFAQNAKRLNADGLMVLPPMRYHADARETTEWFKAIAKSTTLPIMIYNNPVDYKIEVTLPIFEALSKIENIQAVKESTRDVTNVTRMKNAFGDRFKVLSGVDTLALESLLLGADGWVAGLVCAFPKETVAIYQLAKQNRIEEARAIYRWFLPLLELDINAKLVQNIKLAELATGLGTELVRAPRLALIGEERARVQKIIETAIENRPDIPELDREKLSFNSN